jgi:hypothetical protein
VIVFDGAVAVKEGDAAPGTGGGVFARGLGAPSLDAAGSFAFHAPVSGGAVTDGIFLHSGGVTTNRVLPGDPAPNTGGGVFHSFTEVSRTASGDLALVARYTGGVAGTSNVQAVFLLSSGGDVRIAQPSEAAPGGGTFSSFSAIDLGDNGDVAFRAALTSPTGSGVYRYSGAVLTKVAKNGDAAPGGGTFTTPLGAPAVAAAGEVLFGANTTNGGPGVYRDAGAGLVKVAIPGDLAPGGSTYSAAGMPVDGNGASDAVFPAVFAPQTSGIVLDDGSQTPVAVQGGAAPGTGETFANVSDADPGISASGNIVFIAPTNGSPTWGVFVRSGVTTTAVALSGQQVPNSGGAYYGGPAPASFVPSTAQVDDTARAAFAVTLVKDPDLDADGIPDVLDKCTIDSRNSVAPSTCDADTDGYGNPCDPDFDQNYAVNSIDFAMYFIPAFKGNDPSPWPQGMDLDCNGFVGSVDFGMFFIPKFKAGLGGTRPGPSGLACAGTVPCP